MAEKLDVSAAIWAVAADSEAIYLVSENEAGEPDTWSTGPLEKTPGVPVRQRAHRAVRRVLKEHDELKRAAWIHSSGWFEDNDGIVLIYVAALDTDTGEEYVRDIWPHARPLTPKVHDALGQPPNHGPTEQPRPRYFDSLIETVRHMRDQRDRNSTARKALNEHFRRHLDAWEPRLAGQYEYDGAT